MSRTSRNFGDAIDFTFRSAGNILGSAADSLMGPGIGNSFRTSGKIAGTVLGKIGGASIAGATGAARGVQNGRMQRSIDAIEAAVDAEDYERLLPLAREFAERNPKEPMGYAWQAMALIEMERYEQALAATARAVQLGFDESEARLARSLAYDGMADYGGVIRELTPLVSNPEHRPSALLGRASALREIGDLDQALDDANQAIAASPNEVAYVIRGDVYRAKGELARCIDDYNRADRLRPNSSGVLKKRSEVYELLGKTAEADRDLRAAEEASRLEKQTDKSMAEARAFLAYLRKGGVPIKVAPNGSDIEVTGGLKDETIATLRRLKPQLLELLRAE